MISKSTIKLIKSLAYKKFRTKENLFIVEGDKNVAEVLKSNYKVHQIFATSAFFENCSREFSKIDCIETSKDEIKKASLLNNPQQVLAICNIPEKPNQFNTFSGFSLFLDCIQDPGNLGTIIRICDWFGIENLYCSNDTVDLYNPKVIQASMGSFCRVTVFYTSIIDFSQFCQQEQIMVYGTYLQGENVFETKPQQKSIIVIGNEGRGIRSEATNLINKRISIPAYSKKGEGAESLNAGVAAGIICAHFRQNYSK